MVHTRLKFIQQITCCKLFIQIWVIVELIQCCPHQHLHLQMELRTCAAQTEESTHTQDIHEMAPKRCLYKAHGVLWSYWAQQSTCNPEPVSPSWSRYCTSCCIWPVRLICLGLHKKQSLLQKQMLKHFKGSAPLQNQQQILAVTIQMKELLIKSD